MKPDDYVLAAYALKKLTGQEHAILVGPNRFEVARQRHDNPYGDETPVAALLHLRSWEEQDGPNHLYLSYEPTEMCLGLAWRAKPASVSSLVRDGFRYTRYLVGDGDCLANGWRTVSLDASPSPPAPNWGSPASVKEWWEKRSKDYPVLKQAAANPLETRPVNEVIREKLRIGLGVRQAVPGGAMRAIHQSFMRIVYALVRLGWNDKTKEPERSFAHAKGFRPFGNNIAGIMVDAHNRIIAWGLNFKHVNATFHAETMMIQYYLRHHRVSALPPGCRIYTSLECCHMCAGYIATVGENVEVYYGQKDPNIVSPNALERQVRGCRQSPSTLSQVELLAEKIGPNNRKIIDFLFDKKGAKPILGDALAQTRKEQQDRRMAGGRHDPVLSEGNRFLMDLQDMGILHETLGAPLTVSL